MPRRAAFVHFDWTVWSQLFKPEWLLILFFPVSIRLCETQHEGRYYPLLLVLYIQTVRCIFVCVREASGHNIYEYAPFQRKRHIMINNTGIYLVDIVVKDL